MCAATHRWAEAVTVWAAREAQGNDHGFTDIPRDEQRRQAPLQAARHALGPARTSEAEERGAAMTVTRVVMVGGMPGWEISLIAIAAAVFAAASAVLVYRALAARRQPVTAAA
ncbi:MAG TPA: hypothetical protein VHZ33_31285 [Trebonia sp.]|jgi:hypothetical protein|nr:hypothetical protein [Trebonia sp.]